MTYIAVRIDLHAAGISDRVGVLLRSETAVATANKIRLKNAKDTGNKREARAEDSG